MTQRPVRVAIVNDYALVVAGTARVLEPYADRVEVVELDIRKPVTSNVDVILYDTFGQSQGASVDREQFTRDSTARFLVFTWNIDDVQVRESLERGVDGIISKGCTGEELVEAIERAHQGERVASPRPPAEGEDGFGRWPGDEYGLSAREAEVLALICQGLSNADITRQAYLGINTVKTYIRSLYRKIEVSTRSQAVIWGLSHGFGRGKQRALSDHDGGSATADLSWA